MRRSLSLLGWIAMALSFGRALLHVSSAWDVWYYHLPFAARLWGILPAEEVQFDPLNEARYESFPRLAELAQGALWRLSGRPEAANLVSWGALLLAGIAIARVARTRAGWLFLAWLAVPMVQIHASAAYVDLPANACATVLLVVTSRAIGSRRVTRAELALALACAALAVNMKLLLAPLSCAALALLAIRARAFVPVALASPLVFATQLVNLARFHNPAYPVIVRVMGHALPGLEEPYAEVPPRFAPLPAPARFFASLMEIGLHPFGDEHRYTVDQWMPPEMDGNRMGGFLHVYVIAMLIALVVLGRARREGRAAIALFLGVTAVVSVMPQSHVLRYYMVWMLSLVAFVVVLAQRARRSSLVMLAPLAALAITTRATFGWHLTPARYSFEQLKESVVDRRRLDAIPEDARACVDAMPWSVLYAARFHPPRRFSILASEDCATSAPAPAPR